MYAQPDRLVNPVLKKVRSVPSGWAISWERPDGTKIQAPAITSGLAKLVEQDCRTGRCAMLSDSPSATGEAAVNVCLFTVMQEEEIARGTLVTLIRRRTRFVGRKLW